MILIGTDLCAKKESMWMNKFVRYGNDRTHPSVRNTVRKQIHYTMWDTFSVFVLHVICLDTSEKI